MELDCSSVQEEDPPTLLKKNVQLLAQEDTKIPPIQNHLHAIMKSFQDKDVSLTSELGKANKEIIAQIPFKYDAGNLYGQTITSLPIPRRNLTCSSLDNIKFS
ncbi:hypothetical protein CU098_002796, partial [Rhizopus stolonifer]